jgi:hypothetical protein
MFIMRHIKRFFEASDAVRLFNRQDRETTNRQDSANIWIKNHPLEGVIFYGRPAVPYHMSYYQNDNNTFGYSVSFQPNGEEYIAFDGKGNDITRTSVKIGQNVKGGDELISWLHRSMRYYEISPLLIQKMLKAVETEIESKSKWD